ncbi:MAG TPA: hypothetical protein VFE05_12055 [Longimicrobiaceae bacterium]|jgi:hypothetical protein|nr:hypothetical protein [Longimicrobiaceae bacterium]
MTRFNFRSLNVVAGILLTVGGCDTARMPTAYAVSDYQAVRMPSSGARMSASGSGTASKVIGPEGGKLNVGQYVLTFPAGALSQPTEIGMQSVAGYAGVDVSPHGLTFPAGHEPELSLSYKGADLLGIHVLAVGYVGEDGNLDEVLPSLVDLRDRSVSADLHHFSRYLTVGH